MFISVYTVLSQVIHQTALTWHLLIKQDRQTRLNASMNVIVPSIRTAATCKSVMCKGAVARNALPDDAKCSYSLSMFKCYLKRYIRLLFVLYMLFNGAR